MGCFRKKDKNKISVIRIISLWALAGALMLCSAAETERLPKNFHVVEAGVLYRSGQPDRADLLSLAQTRGVATVVNLRYRISDRQEVRHTGISEVRLKLKAQSITFSDMVSGLIAIRDARKPVLVHCLHGSDRTGCLVACYRMVFQNWNREDAIAEFRDEQYGYNYQWFPNLLTFLQEVDIEALKSAVLPR